MQQQAVTSISRASVEFVPCSPLPLWKRASDLCLILLLSPALLIVSVIVAAIIKIGSPGPLLFCQERVGYRGRRFKIYKFRTMHPNAETCSHQNYVNQLMNSNEPMTKLDTKNDPRLIPLAGMLRATGLDELPQVINVLRGDMSFVGPRPCVPYEYEQYEPRHRARFDAVPGLTGLWQVSGKNRTTFERMVQLDIEYSRRLSPWMDTWIILKTFGALAGQCKDQHRASRASNPDQILPSARTCNLQKT